MLEALTLEMVKAAVIRDLGLSLPVPAENGRARCPTFNDHHLGNGKTPATLPAPVGAIVAAADLDRLWMEYETWARVHHRPATLQREKLAFDHYAAHGGDAEAYKVERLRHVSAAGVNLEVRHLKAIFNRAIRLGVWHGSNPFAGVDMIKHPKPEKRTLTADERKRLTAAARAHGRDMLLLVSLGLHTGARVGELLGLEWPDIDLEANTIQIRDNDAHRTKSGKPRTVPICAALRETLLEGPQIAGFVLWPGAQYRARAKYRVCIRGAWDAVTSAAGVEWLTPHGMRHDFASRCAMAGVPVMVLKAWLGHGSVTTTEGYMHMAAGYSTEIEKINGG
jgi:integrase